MTFDTDDLRLLWECLDQEIENLQDMLRDPLYKSLPEEEERLRQALALRDRIKSESFNLTRIWDR